ncbi:hypothetical protein P175DRAFT_0426556 [Aspergillus ochraceoroseus IBT 24754]|uniref:DUF7719 domain-containing protein n=2 Tax=Aspergillus ochraceoroseus TaxID=138278 RepID=A0A2T5MAI0_9EURO|nr:uncharacterized protein P175DRAFT_0426556 [Aspergillus ochraceoroseus IBT 24754]KKK14973.1 hypothetical protein AOCH_004559 [Aspergillus ochraceoroseus]PTU25531.1 hypothetical protein P175DRAFT_0426556 [Aspergillus ochraceoroseus IBT 24754]
MDPPRNRKQRRAAAASASNADTSFDPSSIPLARPPQNNPANHQVNGKKLVDLISERQNELLHGGKVSGGVPESKKAIETRFVTVDPVTGDISPVDASDIAGMKKTQQGSSENMPWNEKPRPEDHEDEVDADADTEPPIPPFLDTLLLSIPLTVLHLTLAYLAAHQYAQNIEMDVLLWESGLVTFPMLTLLIHLAHGHIISFNRGQKKTPEIISFFPWHSDKLSMAFFRKLLFPPSLRTTIFLPAAIFLGARLMEMTNEDTYYAVMKRAPAIGTLWVWCILEIPVGAATLGALGPMIWGVWWRGYGIL